ncbi:hypothetical protein, partial [Klebsiella pneumoniae]|uniref:hypothetical protein n=1 Tax=Klebsiella pneumoniae TaxID=573 RepID=UPI0025573A45
DGYKRQSPINKNNDNVAKMATYPFFFPSRTQYAIVFPAPEMKKDENIVVLTINNWTWPRSSIVNSLVSNMA